MCITTWPWRQELVYQPGDYGQAKIVLPTSGHQKTPWGNRTLPDRVWCGCVSQLIVAHQQTACTVVHTIFPRCSFCLSTTISLQSFSQDSSLMVTPVTRALHHFPMFLRDSSGVVNLGKPRIISIEEDCKITMDQPFLHILVSQHQLRRDNRAYTFTWSGQKLCVICSTFTFTTRPSKASQVPHSLIPRPHPLTRRNGLVNQVEFLGLAHTFCNNIT